MSTGTAYLRWKEDHREQYRKKCSRRQYQRLWLQRKRMLERLWEALLWVQEEAR